MISISPKAFFFDFDGVIVDSEQVHMAAARAASQTYGITFTRDYYYEILLGFDDVGLFRHLWQANHKVEIDDATLTNLMTLKSKAFLQHIRDELVFFDGVLDFIKRLRAANVPLAVVSGALRKEIELCLEVGDLSADFAVIVSANDVAHSKPDPESYRKAYEFQRTHIPDLRIQDCWAIEDAPAGIRSAKGAGMNVIGITNSVSVDALSAADVIVASYNEITIA